MVSSRQQLAVRSGGWRAMQPWRCAPPLISHVCVCVVWGGGGGDLTLVHTPTYETTTRRRPGLAAPRYACRVAPCVANRGACRKSSRPTLREQALRPPAPSSRAKNSGMTSARYDFSAPHHPSTFVAGQRLRLLSWRAGGAPSFSRMRASSSSAQRTVSWRSAVPTPPSTTGASRPDTQHAAGVRVLCAYDDRYA